LLKKLTLILAMLILIGLSSNLGNSSDNASIILKVSINGEITVATTTMMNDALRLAETQQARLILVMLNTPGGEVNAVKDIMNLFDNSNIAMSCFVSNVESS
jgi:membrane-bound serine protease (ClpP class)